MSPVSADDLVLLMKQMARDEVHAAAQRTVLGYIASYDANTASITAVVPSYCQPDPITGAPTPIVVGPIRLGTSWSGNGVGLQVAPAAAAATPQNPAGGEPVLIVTLGGGFGISVAAVMLFNFSFPPPDTGLQPGEAILKSGGSTPATIKLDAEGTIILQAGSTPLAVEGSRTSGHQHGTTGLLSALSAAFELIGATPLTGTSAAGVFSGLAASPTDVATDTIATGQGAQDVVGPVAGGR